MSFTVDEVATPPTPQFADCSWDTSIPPDNDREVIQGLLVNSI